MSYFTDLIETRLPYAYKNHTEHTAKLVPKITLCWLSEEQMLMRICRLWWVGTMQAYLSLKPPVSPGQAFLYEKELTANRSQSSGTAEARQIPPVHN